MRTKISIALVALLVLGVLAMAVSSNNLTSALDTSDTGNSEQAVEASAVVSDVISSEDVQNSLNELENETKPFLFENKTPNAKHFKRVGFTKVWNGNGWITNGTEGHLINGMWVVQTITATSGSNNEEISNIRYLGNGRLKINGVGMYKLKKIESTSLDNEINFYVIPLQDIRKLRPMNENGTKVSNEKNFPIGKLSLKKVESYTDLTIWGGTLTFDSGKLVGSWEVELGTNFHGIKPYSVVSAQKVKELKEKALEKAGASSMGELSKEQKEEVKAEIKTTAKKSFWKRLFFWRR